MTENMTKLEITNKENAAKLEEMEREKVRMKRERKEKGVVVYI